MATPRPSRRSLLWTAAALLTAAAIALGGHAFATGDGMEFTDVESQTLRFIDYYRSIQLTAEQEAVKKEALTALPAPCCSDNTAYTCCCPCNMSLSIWGLSAYLITEKGYDAERLKKKVVEWIEFINPAGFSGDVCYTGGCNRPFKKNGCGGMNSKAPVFH